MYNAFYRQSIYIKITTKEKSGNYDREKPEDLTALQDFLNKPAIISVRLNPSSLKPQYPGLLYIPYSGKPPIPGIPQMGISRISC